ncbi:hypothetical protein [Sediminibacterium soli]|uniref:hypothetical protein n=1 Tax=Sediminibacterium soli TaxID=2698829 RepID=UPI001379B50D|nr:hypothetical protein [Sediminibacterium soli]NCI45676.1 hypothetical protein [Sediminibacterium soli]
MTLKIDRSTKLKDLQAAFTDMFHYLRIEFFRKPHNAYEVSHKKDMRLAEEIALGFDRRHTVAEIAVEGHWKVAELEEMFAREAGLYVQVFRKSGNLWIETSLTDDWTLEQQNREGESLSLPLPVKPIDTDR